MADVLIVGDTERVPELRHEVPLSIPDPFFYVEQDGRRVVVIGSMEIPRIEGAGAGLEARPLEEFGVDELLRAGLDRNAFQNELTLRIAGGLGLESVVVPRSFPVAVADELRKAGVEIVVDQQLFDGRRRVKTHAELAGVRRAQRATELAMGEALELLRAAEPRNGRLEVEGEELTCELVKRRVQAAFLRHGAFSDEPIVSHGAQTAVGHDAGSGAIGPDDVVLLDLFPRDLESACYADMTRTFALGTVPDEIREYHRLCKEALDRAAEAVRPGVDGGELHRSTCTFFAEHGYPTQLTKKEGEVLEDGFYHGLGHGVGLMVHEPPSLGMLGQELVPGDVITLEPGLYRRGFGGVRLEDLLLVTEDGCEVLTDFPYELEVSR
jgi:Xaa-Pro aminopeptidase